MAKPKELPKDKPQDQAEPDILDFEPVIKPFSQRGNDDDNKDDDEDEDEDEIEEDEIDNNDDDSEGDDDPDFEKFEIGDDEEEDEDDDGDDDGDDDSEDDEEDDDDDDPELTKKANKAVRDQLKKANQKAKQAEEENKVLRDQIENASKAEEKYKADLAAAQKKLSFKNPAEHPEVKAIHEKYDSRVMEVADALDFSFDEDDLGEGEQTPGAVLKGSIGSLVGGYNQARANQNAEEGKSQIRNLQKQIKDRFGDDAKKVFELVVAGSKVSHDLDAKISEVTAGASDVFDQEQLEAYQKAEEEIKGASIDLFEHAKAIESSDPLSPYVQIADMISRDDSGKQKQAIEKTIAGVNRALKPLPPMPKSQLEGLDENERAERIAAYKANHEKTRKIVLRDAGIAISVFHQFLPGVMRKLSTLQGGEESKRKSKPKPDGKAPKTPREKEEPVEDITKFEPKTSGFKY